MPAWGRMLHAYVLARRSVPPGRRRYDLFAAATWRWRWRRCRRWKWQEIPRPRVWRVEDKARRRWRRRWSPCQKLQGWRRRWWRWRWRWRWRRWRAAAAVSVITIWTAVTAHLRTTALAVMPPGESPGAAMRSSSAPCEG